MIRGGRAVAAALLGTAVLLGASPAAAQDGYEWEITSFDVDVTVQPDGSLQVVEDIAVDFRNAERHGIFRVIPVRYELSPSDTRIDLPEGRRPDEFYRAIDIDDIEVSSSAPANLEVERPGPLDGREVSLRIGDEDETVTGPQTYRISYTVDGALNAFEGHNELYWNATGNDWEVPIRRARVTVDAPAISEVGCFRGAVGATSVCDRAETDRRTARFVADDLQPGEGLTFVTAFPRDSVSVAPPLLIEKWNPVRAFAGSPAAVPIGLAVLLLGLAGIGLLVFRQGRDRVTRGGFAVNGRIDHEPGERRGLFTPRVTPVEFRPPDDLRPGQLGVLLDERVDPVDVSATIVDLAVRGHLRITEHEERKLFRGKTDWELERLESSDQLLPFERRLLDGLFSDQSPVRVSKLKGTFASDYNATKDLLYTDAKEQGWFARRPDKVRALWIGIGIGVMVLGAGAFVLAMLFTTWAAAVLPVAVLGLVLLIAHRWMPHRTPKGSRMLDKALGFREFVVTAEEGRAEYAEHAQLFVPYLPYAVVFGVVDRWAQTFAALGVETGAVVSGWYVGSYPGSFHVGHFSSGLTDFSSAVGASLPVAPPSSSGSSGFGGGGFSGGGFGGGGGGSW